MKNDLLANRHIGISKRDEEQMLRKSAWQVWTT